MLRCDFDKAFSKIRGPDSPDTARLFMRLLYVLTFKFDRECRGRLEKPEVTSTTAELSPSSGLQ